MDDDGFEKLNVVPFIDVMLVLLVMVLTTATFVASGKIPVSLPQASPTQVDKKPDKTIELGRDGTIAFDGVHTTLEAMKDGLAVLPPETTFLIRADKDLPLQGFIDVADLLKRAKFTHVAIQTRVKSPPTSAGAPTP